jgi:FeS assembly SUF system protein
MPEKLDAAAALNAIERSLLESEVIEAIRTVYDPEIPVNVYDLGLIYGIDVHADGHVDIRMTLTSPACPVAGTLPGEVEEAAGAAPGVKSTSLELVWDPPFSIEMIPEHIRLDLGLL